MPQSHRINRRIVLNSRSVGAPSAANFRLNKGAVVLASKGQVLLRTLYLSLDPYMRGHMSDAASYAAPTADGDVMGGSTVSRFETSLYADYKVGDLVLVYGDWQDFAVADGTSLNKLDANTAHPSMTLGVGDAGVYRLRGVARYRATVGGRDRGGGRSERGRGIGRRANCKAQRLPRGGHCRQCGQVNICRGCDRIRCLH